MEKTGLFSRTRARNEKRIAAVGLFDKHPFDPEAIRTAVLLGRCRSKPVDSHLRRVLGRKLRVLGGAGGKPLHAGPQNPSVMDLVKHGVPDDPTSIAAAKAALAAATEFQRKATELRRKAATKLRRKSSRAQHQADQQANSREKKHALATAAAATVAPSSDSESDDDRTLRDRFSPRAAALAAAPRALAAAPGGESDTEGNNNEDNNAEGLRLANPAEEAARYASAAAEEAGLVGLHGKGHTRLAGYMLHRLAAVAGSGEAAPDYLFDGASSLRAQRPGFNFRNTPHPADGTKRTLLEDALQSQPPPAAESQKERKQRRQWERRQRQRKKQRTNKEAANSTYALFAQPF